MLPQCLKVYVHTRVPAIKEKKVQKFMWLVQDMACFYATLERFGIRP